MGSRTPDLLNAIQTLYQLSYTPKNDATMIPFFNAGRKKNFFQSPDWVAPFPF